MPQNEPKASEENNEDGREFAATIFDGASATAAKIAALVPDATAKTALTVAAGLSAAIGAIIRSFGTDGARELIEKLQARKNEGRITEADLREDNDSIANAVSGFYRNRDESNGDS